MSIYFRMIHKGLPLLLLLVLLAACTRKKNTTVAQRSFYYWKTAYSLNQAEDSILKKMMVHTLYIRYFDVDWDNQNQKAMPVSPVVFLKQPLLKVVPVVYVTNRTMVNISKEAIQMLAVNIVERIRSIHTAVPNKNIEEIQMDCDWTERSRNNYFELLRQIKAILGTKVHLSATIRLHQIKFSSRTGIPPVDRGTLMVYNMARVNDMQTFNSIFDPEIISGYTSDLDQYPLDMDLGFPIYRQLVLFRHSHFISVIRNENFFEPEDLPEYFESFKLHQFRCLRDTVIKTIFIKKGDILREEQPDADALESVVKTMRNQLKIDTFTFILFDLNSNHFKNKALEKFENVFTEK